MKTFKETNIHSVHCISPETCLIQNSKKNIYFKKAVNSVENVDLVNNIDCIEANT